jgi:tRNA dimethylallyltransferase
MNPAPEVLRERIDRRIDEMVHGGLVPEATKLLKRYGSNAIAFDAIGYREIMHFLNGEIAFDTAVAQIKMNTWHYAKRQLTWFRKDKRVKWINGFEDMLGEIRAFLK